MSIAELAPVVSEATRGRAARPWRWPWYVAAACQAVYVATAVWVLYGLPYEIGDALARSADARYMLFSRDPHLAAVGFVWLPLPVLAQLPFMLVLSPLHQAVAAGPLSTTVAGALTIVVVASICRTLGLGRRMSLAVTLAYGLNPIIVFTAANGMSEAWFYLFASIALLGYLRWFLDRRMNDVAILAVGLAGAMAVRYETLAFVPLLALGAGVAGTRGRWRTSTFKGTGARFASIFATASLPAGYVLGTWLFASLLIMKDPFFWAHAQATMGHTPPHAGWLPSHLTDASIVGYSARLTLELAPGLVVLGPLSLVVGRRSLDRMVVGVCLLSCALLFPLLIVFQLISRTTWADPRYFEPCILFTTVATAWVASNLHLGGLRSTRVAYLLLVSILVLGAATGTLALSNPNATAIEQEHHFFRAISLQRDVTQGQVNTFQLAPVIPSWHRLATDLDSTTHSHDHILIDANVSFPAFVFTRHPRRYVVSSDRDFQSIVADPAGKVDYIVQVPGSPLSAQFAQILADSTNGAWHLEGQYSVASVYKLVPSSLRAPVTPIPGG